METIIGTNVTQFTSEGGTPAEIKARIEAFENPPIPKPEPVAVTTPANNDQVQTSDAKAVIPAVTGAIESPQQFKGTDGKLDEEKIQKSNEHLRMGIEERQAKLIKLNKDLREKFRESGTELNTEQVKAEQESSIAELLKGKLTPEIKKRIAEEIENDPVEGFLTMSRLAARQELNPHIGKIESMEKSYVERRELKELDTLINEGHDWIISEGLGRFEQAFNDRPWLRQSKTPYADALRFINTPGHAPSQAHVGPTTPILGSSRAVPPASATPSVSPDQSLADLSNSLRIAIRNKDMAKAAELEAKMDMAYKGRFQ